MKFLFLLLGLVLLLIGIGAAFLTPATDPVVQQQVNSMASGFVVAAAAAFTAGFASGSSAKAPAAPRAATPPPPAPQEGDAGEDA